MNAEFDRFGRDNETCRDCTKQPEILVEGSPDVQQRQRC